MAERTDRSSSDMLAKIASDDSLPVQTRADAAAGLAKLAGDYSAVLNRLSLPRQPNELQEEGKRLTRRTWSREPGRPAQR